MSGWLEFGVAGPVDRANKVLAGGVARFLSVGRETGVLTHGLFLRELGAGTETPVIVQLHPAAPVAEVLELAGEHGLGRPALRPAGRVPLADSAFTGPLLAPITRGFLADVTPALLDVLVVHPDSRSGWLSSALELMTTHLVAVGTSALPGADRIRATINGAPLSFLSFMSHAEAFLATCRDPAQARDSMQRRHEQIHDVVEQRVAAIFAEPECAQPPADTWLRAVRTAKPVITTAFAEGGLHPVAQRDGVADKLATSSFHRILADSDGFQRFLSSDPGFLAVRLLTSLLYLSVHNLGLSMLERYFLCYSISRACETAFAADGHRTLAELVR
jgi:hypothetical protein